MSHQSLTTTAAGNSLVRSGDGTSVSSAAGLIDATGAKSLWLNSSGNLVDETGAAVATTTQSVQALAAAGAVNLTTLTTTIASSGAIALTLADGSSGQIKIITMITDGGDATLTPAHLQGGTTLTFNDVGDTVMLVFAGTKWAIISNNGATLA